MFMRKPTWGASAYIIQAYSTFDDYQSGTNISNRVDRLRCYQKSKKLQKKKCPK
jgi:hypothetical protein